MSGSVCRACVHLKGQGRFVLEIRLDFIVGLSPRRAAARETLEIYRSESLRGFVLVRDQGIKFSCLVLIPVGISSLDRA
jgi:hypothetical protein